MDRSLVLYCATTLALVESAPTAGASENLWQQKRAAIAVTPHAIADMATVTSDPSANTIEISTEPFYKRDFGPLGLTSNDEYVRVLIDKKTGAAVFQIYLKAQYLGGWRFLNRASYDTADGRERTRTQLLSKRVAQCSPYGCAKQEEVVFDIPEAVVRAAAAEARAGVDAAWTFRAYNLSRGGLTTGVLKTELAGALIAAERELVRLGQSGPDVSDTRTAS